MRGGSVGVKLHPRITGLRTSEPLTISRSNSEGAGGREGFASNSRLGSGSIGLLSLVEDLLVLLLGLHERILEVVGV